MLSFANAKINLGLNIVHKRSDGYHDLETVFYPLQVYDVVEVTVSQSNKTVFYADGLNIPGDGINLCEKAYYLLKQDFDIPAVDINLIKKIPIGAGLGGGSSDAAFTLKILNELFELQLKIEQLEEYAKKLGADCPFFIANKPVYATGIGTDFSEILLDLSTYYIVMINPNIHISTVDAYQHVIPAKSERDIRDIIQLPIQEWKFYLKNDFEDGIFDQYPKIKELKGELYSAGALYASMSGSGSSVFGIFEEPINLDHLKEFGTIFYPTIL